jgi:hypothetical protein
MTAYTFSQLFDFTRTTAGTFVGSNGLIQNTPASVNLLTFTQEFDNAAWAKNSLSATANVASAPDGTQTADAIAGDGTLTSHTIRATIVASGAIRHVFSVYLKQGTERYAYLYTLGRTPTDDKSDVCYLDLQLGTITSSSGSGVGGTITSVGNGWYRVAMPTGNYPSSTSIELRVGTSSVPDIQSSTTTGTVLIWGAQLEAGSTATTYTRNNGGVFPARFDYDPVTLAPRGILIEEQRTNLLTYSEQIDNGAWTKVNATVTANSAVAPDGTSTADLVTVTGASGRVLQNCTYTAAAQTLSVYLKASTTADTLLRIVDVTPTTFTLTISWSGGVPSFVSNTGSSYAIQNVGNGWYRVSMTATTAAGAGTVQVFANGFGSSGATLIWGAQVEAGAFATSYIPTVASTVTRSADVCNITAPMFAPWYNQSEGTFVVGVSYLNTANTAWVWAAHSGLAASTNDYIAHVKNSAAINRQAIVAAGVSQGNLEFSGATAETIYQMAGAYRLNDAAFTVNGAAVGTDATVTLPTPNALAVGNLFNQYLSGHIRRITYYPFRASNNQLQALTT